MPDAKDKNLDPTIDSFIPDEVKDKYAEIKNEVTDFVKQNPLASVAIAAGVGFLIARLFAGRKD